MGGDAPDAPDEGASWLCPLPDLWPHLLETEEAVSDQPGCNLIAELGADGVRALREVAGKLDTLREQ